MSRTWQALSLALVAAVGITAWTVNRECQGSRGTTAVNAAAHEAESCAPDSPQMAGTFDPAMSGVCRFSCGTSDFAEKDVVSQPGAQIGQQTRCPVSGVVFAVDAERPRVQVAGSEFVVCCDQCAGKLEKDPARFLRL